MTTHLGTLGFNTLLALTMVVVPHIAAAQGAPVRTRVSFAPGIAFDRADTGPSISGALTVDLSSRLALEGTGAFVGRGSGADAFSLQAGLLAHLLTGDGRVVPFVAGGAGLYRASFDLGAQRFFGGGQYGPGASLCGGTGVCPYGGMPAFYGRRLRSVNAPLAGGQWPSRTFTDPAFHLGVGARVALAPHVFVRPEFRGLFVAADGDVQSLGIASVAFGYQF